MIVRVVGKLEDMGRTIYFLLRGVAVLGSILDENGVCVAGDILVWVDGEDGVGADAGVDDVVEKALANARYDDVVGDGGELCEVAKVEEALMAEGARGLVSRGAAHGGRWWLLKRNKGELLNERGGGNGGLVSLPQWQVAEMVTKKVDICGSLVVNS